MLVIAFVLGLISLAITIIYINCSYLTKGESHHKGAGERDVQPIHTKVLMCK